MCRKKNLRQSDTQAPNHTYTLANQAGNASAAMLDGTRGTTKVTSNTPKTLAGGVIQQDIVSRTQTQYARADQGTNYDEIVFDFKPLSKDQQFVRIARIVYGEDRTIR